LKSEISNPSAHPLARLDQQFVWHPFTQMRDWLRREPIVIAQGKGAVLKSSWASTAQVERRHSAAVKKNCALLRAGPGE
jgi:hypothetical protein